MQAEASPAVFPNADPVDFTLKISLNVLNDYSKAFSPGTLTPNMKCLLRFNLHQEMCLRIQESLLPLLLLITRLKPIK